MFASESGVMEDLEGAARKALAVHGIGKGSSPVKPELWEQFRATPGCEERRISVENRFYSGYAHSELDWGRSVHGIVVDFKSDSMQLGMLLERLTERGEQYAFVGNPLPFNDGWHFSTVNDFEHPALQRKLRPTWQNIRVWSRVNYVPTTATDGSASLTPRESFVPERRHEGAIPVTPLERFGTLFILGGLMPHTLNATAVSDDGVLGKLVAKHLEVGGDVAVVGHGLDVLLTCGSAEQSTISGLHASVFPGHEHVLVNSGVCLSSEPVCRSVSSSNGGVVSAGVWAEATASLWFQTVGLPEVGVSNVRDARRTHCEVTADIVWALDVARIPQMVGACSGVFESGGPRIAVFVDDVADPVEIYTIVAHLLEEKLSFHLISRSSKDGEESCGRQVTSETVFGNAMYGLRDCVVVASTTPANFVPADVVFDSFFVVGGQSPYHLLGDPSVTRLMNNAEVAAAVCHGPEALIGSKWMQAGETATFTAYYGCWMSFRSMLERFVRLKPGAVCAAEGGKLFSGNAPNSTKEMARQACLAIKLLRQTPVV